jgi:hypothetical protein
LRIANGKLVEIWNHRDDLVMQQLDARILCREPSLIYHRARNGTRHVSETPTWGRSSGCAATKISALRSATPASSSLRPFFEEIEKHMAHDLLHQ